MDTQFTFKVSSGIDHYYISLMAKNETEAMQKVSIRIDLEGVEDITLVKGMVLAVNDDIDF